MNYRDYYEILGVNKNSDKAEMKRAYRKLAMQYHPDQNPDDKEAEEKFKEINEAYQVLSDPDKRAHYDRLGTDYSRYQQGGGKPGGFNWGEYLYAIDTTIPAAQERLSASMTQAVPSHDAQPETIRY